MREAVSLKWQDHATGNVCHHEYQGDMSRTTSIICSTYIVADGKEERDGQEKDYKKKKRFYFLE